MISKLLAKLTSNVFLISNEHLWGHIRDKKRIYSAGFLRGDTKNDCKVLVQVLVHQGMYTHSCHKPMKNQLKLMRIL